VSDSVSAVVLAAGMARRMGRLKQLIPLRGKPILSHVLDLARAAAASEIVLVLGFAAEEIRAAISLKGVNIVMNARYQEGIASSLQAGISAVGNECGAGLIMLGDQPFVNQETVKRLIDAWRGERPLIAIPTYNGQRGNPVMVDRALFPEIMQLSGDRGCRVLFPAHKAEILEVSVGDSGVLLDIDVPAELPE
jgi:molybdenum cofactor cytidylyltransferase